MNGGPDLGGATCDRPAEPSVSPIGGGDTTKAGSARKRGVKWHPLKHAAIVAVDACARADHEQFPDFGRHSVAQSKELEWEQDASGSQLAASVAGIQPQPVGYDSVPQSQSTRAVTETNGTEALRGISAGKAQAEIGGDVAESNEKRRKLGSSSLDDAGGGTGVFATKPYLCTGFDAYLVREPCTM